MEALLVKFCRSRDELETFNRVVHRLVSDGLTVLVRDNTQDNIGLSRARNELLTRAMDDVVCFMDFDFSLDDFSVDWESISNRLNEDGVAMVVPWTKGMATRPKSQEWTPKCYVPCNCMAMKREIVLSMGGFDERFFVAYSDWDLVKRIFSDGVGSIHQHNLSIVSHLGFSDSNPLKTEMWKEDYDRYIEKWGVPLRRVGL